MKRRREQFPDREAGRKAGGQQNDWIRPVAEAVLILMVGVFLFLALRGEHPHSSTIREYVVENGSRETGALNLVTAIYLGYRAFDTLGETIVLILSVSGVLLFTETKK